jgi:hypothetical protein
MGARLTSAEQIKRNQRVCALRACGWSWPMISQEIGLTERRCRDVWKKREQFELLEDEDPLAPVRAHFETLQARVEEYAAIAKETDNPNVRLGAINRGVDLQCKLFELKREFGLVPPTVSAARLRTMLSDVLAVHERAGLSDDRHRELLEAFGPTAAAHWLTAPARSLTPPLKDTTL